MSEQQGQMFVARGKNVFLASDRGDEIPEIPAGYFTLEDHPMMGMFLRRVDNFEMPDKIYGQTLPRADKIIDTFKDRANKTTGVLLSGNKGAGKSLLSKAVCVAGVEKYKMPVIILERPYAGPAFNAFMNSIKQPCIIFIDEFEKKYREDEHQNELLSLLDGTGVGQKMYLLTSNSADVSTFLLNRPSRIFYHFQYKKLEEELLMGYCSDRLENPDNIAKMKTLWTISSDMSFDIMQSLVEELNRYPDRDFLSLLMDMNINVAGQLLRRFKLKSIKRNGDRVRISEGQSSHIHLVYFQDGDSQIGATMYIPLEQQLELKKGMKPDEFYFYNHEEEAEFNKTGKLDSDGATEEFPIRLRYEEGTTFLNSDTVVFHRQWNGVDIEVRFEVEQKDVTQTAIEKLFSTEPK